LTVDFDRLDVRPGDVLLDLGCGGGRHSFEALRRRASVVSLDLDRDSLEGVVSTSAAMAATGEIGRPAGLCIEGDALTLPFADGSFDRVIAAEVFEHIAMDRAGFAEVARVLKPGGIAAITVPRWWPERICWALSDEYHANEGGHVRIYSASELTTKLESAGLRVRGSHHAHALHSPYWWIKCAVGVRKDDATLPKLYHRFLVWDLTARPRSTRAIEHALNPILGKSFVAYALKDGSHTDAGS
jgi:SAM-dependent methyltransferase